ncbi:OsmC family protein [Leisingera thetidis]|uniref:OsmC family protein n=1 Tax=Leisingera thetidis TaxID=2930199 RepID=UPI0021F6DBB5|nr:OsmC family protein [Leisingera thetidis]
MNGIDLKALGEARTAVAANRPEGITTYRLAMTWMGGVKMKAETTGMQIGSQKIDREFSWIVDEPNELLGEASAPTPQEFLMSGVGACIMVGFVVNAAAKGIELRSLKLNMSGSLDLAGFMNIGDDAQVKMQGLDYQIEVDCDGNESDLEEVAKAAVEFSPNAMTVKNGIPINGALKIIA